MIVTNVLGLSLIAEGVETAQQVEFLRDIECFQGQGYLWSRPVSALHFEQSILKSDYPTDSFEIWVSSDGSTDGTDEIVKTLANSQVHFHRVKRRAGKVNAILEVVNKADGEILILIDASSRFLETTIKRLTRYFADASIGSVTGRKKIIESKLLMTGMKHWLKPVILNQIC